VDLDPARPWLHLLRDEQRPEIHDREYRLLIVVITTMGARYSRSSRCG